jgi:hypothetical protein
MLACLVGASTGMVMASRKDQDDISLPTAAAGAADIARHNLKRIENGPSVEDSGRRTSLSGPGRHPHGPADQWMAKSARMYPSALTVGWMKLFSIIRVACASAALISGPVTFGFCLTCVNARFCAWP